MSTSTSRSVSSLPRSSALLAIETSTLVARVAVVDSATGAVMTSAEAQAARHSSNLLRLCVEVTEQAGVAVAALRAIACGAGPGSFTGLRVGMAVAKGLAMPTATPFILVSSLEALALDMRPHAPPGSLLLPCFDAGKGQVFAAAFTQGDTSTLARQTDDLAVTPDTLPPHIPGVGPILVAGPGAVRYRDVLAATLGTRATFADLPGPTAVAVAHLAIPRLARGESDDLASSVPSYGRAPDITRPKRPPVPTSGQ